MAHSHSHIFDVSNRTKLNSEERRKLLTPHETLKKLGYQEGHAFADIGCGTGLFTFPAADIGGKGAKILAIDISPEMLADIRQYADSSDYENVETVLSNAYDFKIMDQSADFILICAVLHEIDDKARFLTEARRICKKGGKIAIIEFSETDVGFGPPLDHRLSQAVTGTLLKEAGFTDFETIDINTVYYSVTGINR